jgi:hypothetical protein
VNRRTKEMAIRMALGGSRREMRQPKSQAPRPAYAVWDDGELTLHTATYDVEGTVRRIEHLDISKEVRCW